METQKTAFLIITQAGMKFLRGPNYLTTLELHISTTKATPETEQVTAGTLTGT